MTSDSLVVAGRGWRVGGWFCLLQGEEGRGVRSGGRVTGWIYLEFSRISWKCVDSAGMWMVRGWMEGWCCCQNYKSRREKGKFHQLIAVTPAKRFS